MLLSNIHTWACVKAHIMIFKVVSQHQWPSTITFLTTNPGQELALAVWGTGDNQDVLFEHVSQPYHHHMVSPGGLFGHLLQELWPRRNS